MASREKSSIFAELLEKVDDGIFHRLPPGRAYTLEAVPKAVRKVPDQEGVLLYPLLGRFTHFALVLPCFLSHLVPFYPDDRKTPSKRPISNFTERADFP